MAEVTIKDIDLTSLKGSVVVITGGSGGIGLATVKLLLENGAFVVNGDLKAPEYTHPSLAFHKTDVTSWQDLKNLFKQTRQVHSTITHVFANAGVVSSSSYLDENLDEAGDLLEPKSFALDINLKAAINTATLAIHHMRREPEGGNIVITGSASSFQPLCNAEYTTSKHGVLGFVRSMKSTLQISGLTNIRINAIAPSWTETPLFPAELIRNAGGLVQTADDAAASAVVLMADPTRNGQLVYSEAGRMWEIEEAVLLPAALSVRLPGTLTLDEAAIRAFRVARDEGGDK